MNPIFVAQEPFSKRRDACAHRATAAQRHRHSTAARFIGSSSCSGGPSTKHVRLHRAWPRPPLPGHTRLFNRDNSTVGRPAPEDVDKAGNAKKTDIRQHKQVVSTRNTFYMFISVWIISTNRPIFQCLWLLCQHSTGQFYSSFVLLSLVLSRISAQWESQREEGARHTDSTPGEFWR